MPVGSIAPDSTLPIKTAICPTFEQFAWKWFDVYVRVHNRPWEQHKKRCHLRRHLVPFFGSIKLDEIKTVLVDQYKAEKLRVGLSPKSVNNHLAVLGKCLRSARDWEVLERVPKLPLLPMPDTPFDFLAMEDARRLILDNEEPFWDGMVRLALSTGMRVAELRALAWGDIDLVNRVVTIRRGVSLDIVGPPKNGRFRRVPISQDMAAEFAARRKAEGFVFPGPSGRLLRYVAAQRALDRICARAGVRRVTWHVLRHTFATQLYRSGASLQVIQALLGHATITMTTRYAHVSDDLMIDAVGQLAERYNNGDSESLVTRRSPRVVTTTADTCQAARRIRSANRKNASGGDVLSVERVGGVERILRSPGGNASSAKSARKAA